MPFHTTIQRICIVHYELINNHCGRDASENAGKDRTGAPGGPADGDSSDQSRNGPEKALKEIGNRAPEGHPARVDVLDRIVSGIAVAIKRLWVAGAWDDRIGGDKACQLWIIVSGAIVVEAALWIKYLAGESPFGVNDLWPRPAHRIEVTMRCRVPMR
jgi:hypothetical protein